MILSNIKDAVEGDSNSRISMGSAANLAGKAINITTTTAPHAISYPITTYHGLQHGHAVAFTLGKFFVINSEFDNTNIMDPRGSKYLSSCLNDLYLMFGKSNAEECRAFWYQLMGDICLETDINKIGINSDFKINRITDNVNIDRLKNNPVRITKEIIKGVLC